MFLINEDMSIYLTRGDAVYFTVTAEQNGKYYTFTAGDVVRLKVFERKNCENVVLEKSFIVEAETQKVEVVLTREETKIGDIISKPVDYWYEVELNPYTNPQTIIGYDDDGAKVFRLFPEGADVDETPGGGAYNFEIVGEFNENGLFFGWHVYSAVAVNAGLKALRTELTEAFDEKLKSRDEKIASIENALGTKVEETKLEEYAKASSLENYATLENLADLRTEILGELEELSALIGEVG